ncbi:hypothetical protein V7124_10555 [Neobacillus niacini]|uniref:hypothetical protein n=1 Tax=Neobacillus niacini TaxID=86668 RepID=UPI003000BEBC
MRLPDLLAQSVQDSYLNLRLLDLPAQSGPDSYRNLGLADLRAQLGPDCYSNLPQRWAGIIFKKMYYDIFLTFMGVIVMVQGSAST